YVVEQHERVDPHAEVCLQRADLIPRPGSPAVVERVAAPRDGDPLLVGGHPPLRSEVVLHQPSPPVVVATLDPLLAIEDFERLDSQSRHRTPTPILLRRSDIYLPPT